MFFVAHEYIVRQAAKQIEGLNPKLLSAMIQGVYFPDIKKLPISRFYKGNTHYFSDKTNSMHNTPMVKAYTWGWKLHSIADALWHKGIYSPMKSPICINIGDFDQIRNRIMSVSEHLSREIALDLHILEISKYTDSRTSGSVSLKDLFTGRDRASELGFWCYGKIVTTYFRMIPQYSQVLLPKKIPRRLARNYQFITEEITNSVDKMLETTITASIQALKEYLKDK